MGEIWMGRAVLRAKYPPVLKVLGTLFGHPVSGGKKEAANLSLTFLSFFSQKVDFPPCPFLHALFEGMSRRELR